MALFTKVFRKYFHHYRLSLRRIQAFVDSGSDGMLFLIVRNFFSFFIPTSSNIYLGNNTYLSGRKNIEVEECLDIGIIGLHNLFKKDTTVVSCKGKMVVKGYASLGKGIKLYVAENAFLQIGRNSYLTGNSNVCAQNSIIIGENCALSWNLNIIDSDYHEIEHTKTSSSMTGGIVIGNNVWIGCNVTILKNVTIADGVVVAANSVVNKSIHEENVLVAGNPAVIVRKNIRWKR